MGSVYYYLILFVFSSMMIVRRLDDLWSKSSLISEEKLKEFEDAFKYDERIQYQKKMRYMKLFEVYTNKIVIYKKLSFWILMSVNFIVGILCLQMMKTAIISAATALEVAYPLIGQMAFVLLSLAIYEGTKRILYNKGKTRFVRVSRCLRESSELHKKYGNQK